MSSEGKRWTLMPGGHFRGPEFEGESMEVVPASEVERLERTIEQMETQHNRMQVAAGRLARERHKEGGMMKHLFKPKQVHTPDATADPDASLTLYGPRNSEHPNDGYVALPVYVTEDGTVKVDLAPLKGN